MKNDKAVTDISDLAAGRYPHMKLTAGNFPRLLATRRIEGDDDEYFGAFLPKTAIRIFIDLLNKNFRLRSCDIDIDGSFPAPCTQYYRRRCTAPCVASICSRTEYALLVDLVRLVLRNERELFRQAIGGIIERLSDELEFERAAHYRDIAFAVDKFWANDRWQVWLADAVDTFAIEDTPQGSSIYLVTHRDRRVLGRKVFHIEREDFETVDGAIDRLLDGFYQFHLPREIRLSRDFYGRRELAQKLSRRHNRQARIIVTNLAARGINAYRGLLQSHAEVQLDKVKPLATPEIISSRLKRVFGLKQPPRRIEAFDVAHISGTGLVAASAVWINGRYVSEEYRYEISEQRSEIAVLAGSVKARLADGRPAPDLIMLDGGKGQLNGTLKALRELADHPPIIAAVKPPGKHSAIAAFLTESGGSVPFDIESPAHAMLQLLRDEAHNLSNRIHRDYREMKPFYEAAGHEEPLIVPIRLYAENGGAEDLIPIETR